jgi:predicted nucleic acid-binding protein
VGRKKIFIDANIFNDLLDDTRRAHSSSKRALLYLLEHEVEFYTSCDIVTNIYYVTAKYTSKEKALDALEMLKESVEIIAFGKEELDSAIALMRQDRDYTDLEDTIQYVLALREGCDRIISNDKRFVSKAIDCCGSQEFMEGVDNDQLSF